MTLIIWKILGWLQRSFSAKDDAVSSIRLTTFWFVMLETVLLDATLVICYMVVFKVVDISGEKLTFIKDMLEFLHWVMCLVILLLLGVVKFQQIVDLKTLTRSGNTDLKTVAQVEKAKIENDGTATDKS